MNVKSTLLVVDDQLENLLILEDVLSADFNVLTASSGEQALALIETCEPIDVALLDVVMPGISGYELCRRLKAAPQTKHIPVLFLTSLTSSADEAEGFAVGGQDFINKPFSASVVLARIQTHLQLAKIQRHLAMRNDNLERLVEERTHELLAKNQDLIIAQ